MGAALPQTAAQAQPMARVQGTASLDIGYSALYVAQNANLYQRYGIDSPPIAMFDIGFLGAQAMLAGQAQQSSIAELPIVNFLDQGADLVSPACNFLGDNQKIVVRKAIQQPQDLVGKRIGMVLGSNGAYAFGKYLDHFKIQASTVKITNVGVSEQVAALVKGDIDGFVWGEPNISRAMTTLGDQVGLLSPNIDLVYHTHAYLLFVRSWATRNRKAVEAVLRAQIGADQMIRQKPEQAATYAAQTLKIDTAEIMRVWKTYHYDFRVHLDAEVVNNLVQVASYLKDQSKIGQIPNIIALFDASYLRAVDPGLVQL
jgi:ABC-type nitrate/sulfonate/bicarbonate transport system substrate-binding protein